jgi:class 3 adenylate cyclase
MTGYDKFYHHREGDTNQCKSNWFFKFVALLLLLFIIIYPLVFIEFKAEQKSKQQQKWLIVEQKNLLQTELADFRNDIEPEFFLKKLAQKVCPESFSSQSLIAANQISDRLKQKQAYKNLFNKIFTKLSNYPNLKKPFFLVIGDKTMNNLEFYISPRLIEHEKFDKFKIDSNNPQFLAKYIGFFSLLSAPVKYLDKNFMKSWKNFARKAIGSKKTPPNSKTFFKGILNSFLKNLPVNGLVNNYFSDIFSMQNLYLYSHVITSHSNIQGFISIGYLEDQLSFNHIKSTLKHLNTNSTVVRYFPEATNQKFASDLWITNEKSFFLKVADSQNKKIKLGIAIKKPNKSLLQTTIEICSWLQKMAILFWFAATIQALLFDLYFPFNLRKKLLFIFSPAILLPAIAIIIIFYGISQNSFSVKKNLARANLETELNRIELSYQEVVDRQVLNNLTFKYRFGKDLENHELDKISLEKYQPYFGKNMDNSFIYHRSGKYLKLFEGKARESFDRVKFTNALFALKTLGKLEENAITRKHLQELTFTYGMAYNVAGMFDFSEAAGHESENIPQISNINPISRGHFYLFASSNDPELKPRASAIMGLETTHMFALLVASNPDYPLNYFYNHRSDYSTEICLGIRDSSKVIDESWIDLDIRRDNVFKNIFQKANNSKESGTAEDEGSGVSLHSWRYYPERPVLLAGVTKLKEQTFKELFLLTTPFFVLAIMLTTLFLIAEILANLFLKPIELIKNAVSEITRTGDYAIKVELSNNDEFDRLGTSFNMMTAGLLQKKHISRFVSQRLVSAIEKNQQTDLSNQSKEMTILASDIRNFTTISETHPPELVVEILNKYFTCMEACIIQEGGIIDKFIGDAIIAVFLPDSLSNPALAACKSALKMRAALKDFNQQLSSEITIENGVGISSGKAIAATLGKSCNRKDFTIVGDLVETAESLEAISKKGKHSRVVIDNHTANLVNEAFVIAKISEHEESDIFEIVKESSK